MKIKFTILVSTFFLLFSVNYAQTNSPEQKERKTVTLQVKQDQPKKVNKVMLNKTATTKSHLKALDTPKETPIKKEEKQEIKK